jgi:hypothetical protein
MKFVFFLMIANAVLFSAKASSDPSLGVVITEIRVKTMFSDNGFFLKMSYDKNTGDHVLSEAKLYWEGKEIDVLKGKLPTIVNPSLSDLHIYGIENSNDAIILVIPYNFVDPDEGEIIFNETHDAIELVFRNGNMVTYRTAVANKERTQWQISSLDTTTNKLEPGAPSKSKRNPFLK